MDIKFLYPKLIFLNLNFRYLSRFNILLNVLHIPKYRRIRSLARYVTAKINYRVLT